MVILSLAFVLLCVRLFAQSTTKRSLTAANGQFIGFLEFRPGDYESEQKHPLIIFLHGIGEHGNGTTDLHKIHCCGLPSYIRKGHNMEFTWNGKTESFVVLMPQLAPKFGGWQSFYVNELIDYAKRSLNIDADRIFVTGLSLGGGGTWTYASESQDNAEKLAGIVPVVAPCMMTNGCNIANAQLPVLAVHSANDKTASPTCTTDAIKAITDCGASAIPNLIMYPDGGHAVWLKRAFSTDHSYQQPNIYEWMLAQHKKLNPNKKPKALADVEVTVSGNTSIVTLTGTGSTDPDGTILRHAWRRISGPGGADTSGATVSLSNFDRTGTYRYELKVVDDRAEWSLDTISFTINTVAPADNGSPVADAGEDKTLVLPENSVMLDGSGSIDGDGMIAGYQWNYVNGPEGWNIINSDSVTATIGGLVKGAYQFSLTVTDNEEKTNSDTVIINVVDYAVSDSNRAPVAVTGPDIRKRMPDNSVILNGQASFDPDGTVARYFWEQISGPDSVGIQNRRSAIANVDGLSLGTYRFRLTVTDDKGRKGSHAITVDVLEPNEEPVAIAGEDETITSDADIFNLDGSESFDADGTIEQYVWRQIDGPGVLVENIGEGTTKVKNAVSGSYVFVLTVTDDMGDSQTDTVVINFILNTNNTAITIYPNPVKDLFNVKLSGEEEGEMRVQIYDMQGRVVSERRVNKNSAVMNVEMRNVKLHPGMYYLRIAGKEKSWVKKFVK